MGPNAATLYWKPEPSEGWHTWEKKVAPRKGEFYATKWHYICYDYPGKPWFEDDASDVQWWENFVPMLNQGKRWWRNRYAGRVPREISEHEKKEIRKWVWCQLYPYMELKMKLAYFADPHPDYLRIRSLQ